MKKENSLINFFKNLSIKSKFVFAFTFLILLIAIFINIYFPRVFRSQAFDFVKSKAVSESKIISYNISSALFFNDLDAMEESIEAAKLNENIIYVVVTDDNNKILKAYNSKAAEQFEYLKISYANDYSHYLTVYKICSNITYKGEKIGNLYLAHSLIELNERAYEIQLTISTISATILILAILFVIGISTIITKPLNRIVNTFKYIADGDLSQRANISQNDEIGKLAKSFNQMVDNLETAYNNLKSEIETRKKTEEELQNAKDDLYKMFFKEKELNVLKSRFISMVSHEFRTPLTVIMNASDIVKTLIERKEFEDALAYHSKIKLSIDTLTNLLQDVLVFAKTEQSELTPAPVLFDPIVLCKRIIEEMKIIDNEQHIFEFYTNFESVKILSDRQLLRHILVNLISNSIKYSNVGTVIRLEFIEYPDNYCINLIDNGFGISEDDQKYLFKAFFRGKKNIGTIKGFGLGLNIVKKAVDALNGEISYKSKLNEGTTFTIKLSKN